MDKQIKRAMKNLYRQEQRQQYREQFRVSKKAKYTARTKTEQNMNTVKLAKTLSHNEAEALMAHKNPGYRANIRFPRGVEMLSFQVAPGKTVYYMK